MNGKGNGYFTTVPALLESLKATFGKVGEMDELKDKVLNADILLLDDIGTENLTDWASSVMFEIINDRYINERITLYTSNLNPEELEKRIGRNGEKIISRIFGTTRPWQVVGKDERIA